MRQNYTALFLKSIFPKVVFTSFDVHAIHLADAKYLELHQLPKTPCFCFVVDANGAYDPANRRYVNIRQGRAKFERGLEKIRLHSDYIADYIAEFGGNTHVILMKMEEHDKVKAFKFMAGEYSQIYTPAELKALHLPEDSVTYGVLNKTPWRKKAFQDQLNQRYYTCITLADDDDRELLEKPSPIEEVLNGYYGFSFDK